MASNKELRCIVSNAIDSGMSSEEDVRSKFITPFLKWLGYPDCCRAENFPVYFSEGSTKRTKQADYILFSEEGFKEHKDKKREDMEWVQDHCLLVVEAKKEGEMPETFVQPQFYRHWTKALAYIITDGSVLSGFLFSQDTADYQMVNCRTEDLWNDARSEAFTYNELKSLKRGKLDVKTYITNLVHNWVPYPEQLLYEPVENYIQRWIRKRISLKKDGQRDTDDQYDPNDDHQVKTLLDAAQEEKQIVLIGEAGTGKSCELKQLAYQLSLEKQTIPVMFSLREYTDEPIEMIVKDKTGREFSENSILILDAFDEIDEQCVSCFIRRLQSYTDQYPIQKIVLSTRSSFYKFSNEYGGSGYLSGFQEYELCPVKDTDIDNYLQENEISIKGFEQAVQKSELSDMIKVPFYLSKMVQYYKKNASLPDRNVMMELLIRESLLFDDHKYTIKRSPDDEIEVFFSVLEKAAFLMQVSMKQTIPDDMSRKVFDDRERDSLRQCGLWVRDSQGNGRFEHSLFQEYLCARFLSTLSLDSVLSVIESKKVPGRIKIHWIESTTFLLQIKPEHPLMYWIFKNDPFVAMRNRPDRLNIETRNRIFREVWKKFNSDSLVFIREDSVTKQFAYFGQTNECCSLLCYEVRTNPITQIRLNALRVLKCMEEYGDTAFDVREVLRECIEDSEEKAYVKIEAIYILDRNTIYMEDDISWLLKLQEAQQDPDVRICIYHYILHHGLQETCLDFIFEGIDFLNNRFYRRKHSIQLVLGKLLKGIHTRAALHMTFEKICDCNRIITDIYDFLAIITNLIENAVVLYKEGCKEFAADLIKLHITSVAEWRKDAITAITWKALGEINQRRGAFDAVLKEYTDHPCFASILKSTLDAPNLKALLAYFQGGGIVTEAVMEELMICYQEDSSEYRDMAEAVYNKTGIYPTAHHHEKENVLQQEYQAYFNSLFDQGAFRLLLNDLLDFYHKDQLTFCDLKKQPEDGFLIRDGSGLRTLWDKLYSFVDGREEQLVTDFCSLVQWEYFSISEIYELLIYHRDDLMVDANQINYIREYTERILRIIDFDAELSYGYSQSTEISITNRLCYVCFFSSRFDFELDDKIYEKMLLVPSDFFETLIEDGDTGIAQYLLDHLSRDNVRRLIKEYWEQRTPKRIPAEGYIVYARNQNWSGLIHQTEDILRDSFSTEFLKTECIRYLKKWKEDADILRTYFNIADRSFQRCLLQQSSIEDLVEEDKNWLKKEIEKIVKKFPPEDRDNVEYLGILISLNSRYGLERYYDISERLNGIPDDCGAFGVSSITEAIRDITDISLLDIIEKLTILAYGNGFKDNSIYGLKNSVGHAFVCLGIQFPKQVLDCLKRIKSNCDAASDLAYFCGFYIDELLTIQLRNSDVSIRNRKALELYESLVSY